MRHRGKNRGKNSNLDSLLDTMTNVVGILVIVLIMTQVNVADAIRRLRSALPDVSHQQMEQLVEEVRHIDEELALLNSPDGVDYSRIEAVQAKVGLLRVELEREKLEVRPENELVQLIAARKKALKKQTQVMDALEKESSGLLTELASVKALVNKPPVRVRLPDPRPARDDASEILMACVGNRVYVIDGPALQSIARKKLETAGRKVIHSIEGAVDKRKTIYKRKESEAYIVATNTGNTMAAVTLRTYPDRANATLIITPRPDGGQAISEIRESDRGVIRMLMQQAFLDRDYVNFYVTPDAFATYLEARRIAEVDYNLPVGWEFIDQNVKIYKGAVGLRFEHTPPVASPAPKPTPKPKPRPPPGKPNVLD